MRNIYILPMTIYYIMNRETKGFAIGEMDRTIGQTVENVGEFFDSLGIKPMDVFTRFNDKYTHKNEDGHDRCSTWTMSNGNAWECPALALGLCDMDCYGLKGTFVWNDVRRNKHFQGLVMQIADANWLFEAIKTCATNKRLAKGNELLALRLNEVSDHCSTNGAMFVKCSLQMKAQSTLRCSHTPRCSILTSQGLLNSPISVLMLQKAKSHSMRVEIASMQKHTKKWKKLLKLTPIRSATAI